MWKLWQRPTLATLLGGYALTLLAFLFFGRYFQGNYLGYILAVATPVMFLTAEARVPVKRRVRARREQGPQLGRERTAVSAQRESAPVAIPAPKGPASTDGRPLEPAGSDMSGALAGEPVIAPAGSAVD
jgi:hypothetical protein